MSGPVPSMPPRFRPAHQRSEQERRRQDDQRRGTAHQRGYTGKWAAESRAFRFENPLCVGCKAVGRNEAATLTDHIVPHKGDMKLFWRRSNWQPLCDWHHSKVKQQLEIMWAAGSVGSAALRMDSDAAIDLTRRLMGD